MRTYNVTFSESNYTNVFTYKANNEDFRSMRRYIMRAENGLEKVFTDKLVDVLDDVKEMKVGETKFVITSECEIYTAETIEVFNMTIAREEKAVRRGDFGKESAHFMPNDNKAFMIRRTPKTWKLYFLVSELN